MANTVINLVRKKFILIVSSLRSEKQAWHYNFFLSHSQRQATCTPHSGTGLASGISLTRLCQTHTVLYKHRNLRSLTLLLWASSRSCEALQFIVCPSMAHRIFVYHPGGYYTLSHPIVLHLVLHYNISEFKSFLFLCFQSIRLWASSSTRCSAPGLNLSVRPPALKQDNVF